MNWILAILAVLLCLILVVGVHELGHALVAHYCGVKIHAINIGMGRPFFCWHSRNGVIWQWCRWPIGGSVDLLNSRIQPVKPEQYPYCFDKIAIWKRLLILISGSGANILAAWLLLTLCFFSGYSQTSAVIASVLPNSSASAAGLNPGDTVVQIGGLSTPSWSAAGMAFLIHTGQPHLSVIVLKPDGQRKQTYVNLRNWDTQHDRYSLLEQIGLHPDNRSLHNHYIAGVSWTKAMAHAFQTAVMFAYFYMILIKQIVTKTIPFFLLLGPIGVVNIISESFMHGLTLFMLFIAQLHIAGGLFNLLPIPSLDGGSILYATVEKIRGKPMSVALEILIYRLTLIGLMLITVQLILNDLQRYYVR